MAAAQIPFAKDLAWRTEAVLFDAVSALARLCPIEAVSGFGARLFRWLGPLTPSSHIVERNVDMAFPELTASARAALIDAQWDNLGRTFFEFPLTDRLTPARGRIEVVDGERLAAIARSGKPAVLISGHFANWEVMAAVIAEANVPCRVTYRAANNPYIDRRIIAGRARYGVKLFAPKGGLGGRDLLQTLKENESIAILNDQKYNSGVAAPFFGKIAHTAGASVRIALKFDAPLVPMSVQRLPRARFRVVIHEPIALEKTGSRERDIEAGVHQINTFIEARVRERPSEWFWVHKRWPRVEYEK